MATPEKISEALQKMDAGNDTQWTAEGLPKIDTVRLFAADPTITREQVTAAAPGFSRVALAQYNEQQKTPPAAETPAATAPAVVTAAPTAPQPAHVPAAGAVAGLGIPQNPLAEKPVHINATPLASIPEPKAAEGELEALQDELAQLEEVYAGVEKTIAEATAKKKLLDEKMDGIKNVISKLTPRHDNTNAIQEYLQGQQRIRQERGERLQQLKGIPLAEILPKRAPIDQVMARQTGYGKKRPGT